MRRCGPGSTGEVLAEAQARVAEAPLRERRWALLALAQYQAGRQGEALRTCTRPARVLGAELGVDPGPDLVALEQAILRQDPSLVAEAALPEPGAVCPYLGLWCPTTSATPRASSAATPRSAPCLVGWPTAACSRWSGRRVAASRRWCGPGWRPRCSATAAGWSWSPPAPTRWSAHRAARASGPAPVLVVDQCEEAVTLCDDPDEQAAVLRRLAAHAERAPLVVALRADRLGELSAHPGFARLVEPGLTCWVR